MSWYAGFERICRSDVPLSEYTWYRLGGPARWMIEPRDTEQLAAVVARCEDAGVTWRVLGCGANVLISDAGFDGAVIRLSEPHFLTTHFQDETVTAGAGADFPRLVRSAIERGLVGLEALAGIPGTMGGIIRMNAGGRYGEIAQFASQVTILDRERQVRTLTCAQVGFSYRHTDLEGCIVLAAALTLKTGDRAAALQRHRDIWTEKHSTQPPLAARSSGCIFKNPPGHAAGRLLDEAGLKGARAGSAQISQRHANFIVAGANTTTRDVLELIDLARERVRKNTGIELELEVQIW